MPPLILGNVLGYDLIYNAAEHRFFRAGNGLEAGNFVFVQKQNEATYSGIRTLHAGVRFFHRIANERIQSASCGPPPGFGIGRRLGIGTLLGLFGKGIFKSLLQKRLQIRGKTLACMFVRFGNRLGSLGFAVAVGFGSFRLR